ncbi:MAG: hypothetical protein ACREV2_18685, partial [Burkholderiales bacterium]
LSSRAPQPASSAAISSVTKNRNFLIWCLPCFVSFLLLELVLQRPLRAPSAAYDERDLQHHSILGDLVFATTTL